MKIGLIGWYGHNNEGDERILYCLKKFFGEHEIFVAEAYDDAIMKIHELNKCDFVLFGGGGLILRGYGRYSVLFEKMTARFGCVGLGIESKHKSTLDLIDVIKEKAEFILVRDKMSLAFFENHFKVILGPDLTFLYPFHQVPEVRSNTCGVNLRHWHYWKGEYQGRFHFLMKAIESRIPKFGLIYPMAKWDSGKAVEILRDEFDRLNPISLYNEDTQTSDFNYMKKYFSEVSNWFSYEQYKTFRYFIGMRLHSVVFATQMGIPFISLSYQGKNSAFCKSIGMEKYSLALQDFSKLPKLINNLKADYSEIRSNLIERTRINREEIRHIMSRINDLMTGRSERLL